MCRPRSRRHYPSGKALKACERCTTRSTGIATGTTRASTWTPGKETAPRDNNCRPRRATEATHPPSNDQTGFPAQLQVGVTNRCRLEPRGALATPAKSLRPERGPRERTDDHGIHFLGRTPTPAGQDLAALPFGDDTHLGADAGTPAEQDLADLPVGAPDRRRGSGPEGPSPCRELPQIERHIARVSTRTARVPGVATERTPPHPGGEATVEGRAPVERPELALANHCVEMSSAPLMTRCVDHLLVNAPKHVSDRVGRSGSIALTLGTLRARSQQATSGGPWVLPLTNRPHLDQRDHMEAHTSSTPQSAWRPEGHLTPREAWVRERHHQPSQGTIVGTYHAANRSTHGTAR